MNVADLVVSLCGRGLVLARGGEALHVAPAAFLTDADRAAIREYKPALLAILASAPTCSACGRATVMMDAVCDADPVIVWWCRRLQSEQGPGCGLTFVMPWAVEVAP